MDKMKQAEMVLRRFKDMKPWAPPQEPKFKWLLEELAKIFGINIQVNIRFSDKPSVGSYCMGRTIYLIGRPSVITALHEFAHALGMGQLEACDWSEELFFKVFPEKKKELKCIDNGVMGRVWVKRQGEENG